MAELETVALLCLRPLINDWRQGARFFTNDRRD